MSKLVDTATLQANDLQASRHGYSRRYHPQTPLDPDGVHVVCTGGIFHERNVPSGKGDSIRCMVLLKLLDHEHPNECVIDFVPSIYNALPDADKYMAEHGITINQ